MFINGWTQIPSMDEQIAKYSSNGIQLTIKKNIPVLFEKKKKHGWIPNIFQVKEDRLRKYYIILNYSIYMKF